MIYGHLKHPLRLPSIPAAPEASQHTSSPRGFPAYQQPQRLLSRAASTEAFQQCNQPPRDLPQCSQPSRGLPQCSQPPRDLPQCSQPPRGLPQCSQPGTSQHCSQSARGLPQNSQPHLDCVTTLWLK